MEMRDREDARLERCYDVPIYFTTYDCSEYVFKNIAVPTF